MQNTKKEAPWSKTLKIIALCALALAFFYLMMRPYLLCGFYDDDAPNSSQAAYLRLNKISSLEFFLHHNRDWLNHSGRIYPIALLQDIFFKNLNSLRLYRDAHVFMVFVNLACFFLTLKQWGRNIYFSLLATILVLTLFQARTYHDPITSFCALLQTVFLFGALSIYYTNKFISKNSIWSLSASALCYAFVLLTYEVGLSFLPVILAILYLNTTSKKECFYASSPFIVITAAYLGATKYFRLHSGMSYDAIQLGSIARFFSTFKCQVFAALPLNFFFNMKNEHWFNWKSFSADLVHGRSIALFIIGFCLFFFVINKLQRSSRIPSQVIMIFSALMLLIPSMFPAISRKYQVELRPGLGYHPVYLAYFGVAAFIALLVYICIRLLAHSKNTTINKMICCIFAALFSVVAVINVNVNYMVVRAQNLGWMAERVALEKALHKGLFSEIKDDSIIISDTSFYWLNSAFIFGITGKRLYVIAEKSSIFPLPTGLAANKPDNINPLTNAQFESPFEIHFQKGNVFLLAFNNPETQTRSISVCPITKMSPQSTFETGPKCYVASD